MDTIDLTKYKLVYPASIKTKKNKRQNFIDIGVDNDNTFHVVGNDHFLYLTHNCDGGHISALLVNLFFKWFPYIIDEGRLYRLRIPLLSIGDGKKRQFFFDLKEFDAYKGSKTNIRYLKGLGSLSEDDWEVIMNNKQLQQIHKDDEAGRYLEMAFGRDSMPRKLWLKGNFK